MNKIKEFFEKKEVKVSEGVLIAIASAGLIYGGVTTEGIATIPSLASGILVAIEAVVTLIQGITTKSK